MFGKIRRNSFFKTHGWLREHYILRLRYDLCEDAKRHIHRGFIVRLDMIESALISLDSGVGKSDAPLSHYLAGQLTLFLNAYYLNLAGSLDNLAWALAYQHKMVDGIDEGNRKHQRIVQLVGNDFLKLLREKNLEVLGDLLISMQDWYWDIRKFRDPFAHRIPLLVPHSIYSDSDAVAAQEMDSRASEFISNGEWRKGMDLLHQSFSLGKHVPVFIAEGLEMQLYDLASRIDQDHEMWLNIVNAVFKEGFKSKN